MEPRYRKSVSAFLLVSGQVDRRTRTVDLTRTGQKRQVATAGCVGRPQVPDQGACELDNLVPLCDKIIHRRALGVVTVCQVKETSDAPSPGLDERGTTHFHHGLNAFISPFAFYCVCN